MNAQQFQNALVALISEHWSFFRQFISLEPTLRHITDASRYANSIATLKHDPTFVELYAASQILKADIVVRRQDNETHICPLALSIEPDCGNLERTYHLLFEECIKKTYENGKVAPMNTFTSVTKPLSLMASLL